MIQTIVKSFDTKTKDKLLLLVGGLFLGFLLVAVLSFTAPASAGDPPPIPLGFGDPPSEIPKDPIFIPFADEYIITVAEGTTSYYLPSNNDGTFGNKSSVITATSDGAAIADFDNDGDLDFVIGAGFPTIVLYRNDGGGLFNPVTVASNVPAFFHTQMRAADFNEDGLMDFTSGSLWFSPSAERVYINQGNLVFTPLNLDASWINNSVYGREVGDFNQDGHVDIAVLGLYGPTTGKVRIYYGNGNGTFQSPVQVVDLVALKPGISGTSCLGAGDFNTDGNLDLLVGCGYFFSPTQGLVYLFVGDGAGNFTFQPGSEANQATLDLNDGVTIGQGGTDAFDFDKDGKLDVVSVNWNGAKLFYHKGNGDGTFQPRVLVDSAIFNTAGIAAPPSPPGVLKAPIDIKPGSFPNSINTKAQGTIPVAILSTASFDATKEVNTASLTFGRTGSEQSLGFCTKSPEDVNGDGLLDQVCHFGTQKTGFVVGDIEGILKGKTTQGLPFEGRDSVRIVK